MSRHDPFALAETLAFVVWNIAALSERVPRGWLRNVPDPASPHHSAETLEQLGNLLHATDFRRSYEIPHHRYQDLIEGLVRRWDQELAGEFRRHCEEIIPGLSGGSEGFWDYFAEKREALEAGIVKANEGRARRKREQELQSGKAELDELLELDAAVIEATSSRGAW